MKREFLEGLGLEKEAIDKIMAEHGKTVNDLKEKASDSEELKSRLQDLESQIEQRDEQLNELGGKVKDNEELTAEIERLKSENEETVNDYKEKLEKQIFESSLERELNKVGARNPKAVKALLDVENIKLDNNKLLGLEEQLEALKESEGYLFAAEEPRGLKGRKPHEPEGNPTGLTTEQFNSMGYAERVELKKSNPEQYNKLTGRQ